MDTVSYYGCAAWIASNYGYGAPFIWDNPKVEYTHKDTYRKDMDAMVRTTTIRTPDGDLTSESTCFRADPPSPTQKPLKNLEADFPKFRHLLRPPTDINLKEVETIRKYCHERNQAYGIGVGYPGLHGWFGAVQDGLESLAYASIDNPAILDEWFELDMAIIVKTLELLCLNRNDTPLSQ